MRYITNIITLTFILLAFGCATRGLPPSSHIVGGGAQIDWQSLQSGTAILVERGTGKVVATKSLMAGGDPFVFDLSTPGDSELVKRALGTVPPNAEFVLYFVPSPTPE